MCNTNQADPAPLQELQSVDRRCGRDGAGSAPSNLSGWALWLYVALLLEALAAIMAPPIWRALRTTWEAL